MSPKQFVLALLLLISLKSTRAAMYRIIDHSDEAPGGNIYANELNDRYKFRVLSGATRKVLSIFNQKEGEGKKYDRVNLLIESFHKPALVASTQGNLIRLNTDYLQRFKGDIREEFAGVVYHEMTRVWQWTGNGMAPTGLVSGIADYVRLKAGYASKGWPGKGSGSRWDEGFAVTAYFLDYCNDLKHGFVAELNALMKDHYSEEFFVQLLGKSVRELWRDYNRAYSAGRIRSNTDKYRKPLARTRPTDNYIKLNPEYVQQSDANLNSLENKPDFSRPVFPGVAFETNHFEQNNIAERAKDLVKDLRKCNGYGACLLFKVSAMIEKAIASIPFVKSRKLGMNHAPMIHW